MSTQALARDKAIRRLLAVEAEIRRPGVRRSAHTAWPKPAMSFKPRDYLRHILAEADYRIEQSAAELLHQGFRG